MTRRPLAVRPARDREALNPIFALMRGAKIESAARSSDSGGGGAG